MARSMPGTRDACQMPCVSSRAEMSGARDTAMMQAFRHEYGILCAILTGLMESTQHTRLILDPFPSSNLHCSVFRLFFTIIYRLQGSPIPAGWRSVWNLPLPHSRRDKKVYHDPTQAGIAIQACRHWQSTRAPTRPTCNTVIPPAFWHKRGGLFRLHCKRR